jgi:dihydrofolate synthase/folylpolyglutamate synthase
LNGSAAAQARALIDRLGQLHPKKIDLSLGRLESLLKKLGNPERKLPPVIHVAGTNGKGSTIAFLRAVLEAAGLSVHIYTSPHLVNFNERIRLGARPGGTIVGDEKLAAALSECETANGGEAITFFEITTAAAFLIFSRHKADVLLLEVGLGGRLDATNVIEKAAMTVITPVSIDHTDFLGASLEGIAAEKAGILKRNTPAVIARQIPEALAVIERAGAKVKAKLAISGEQWSAHEEAGRLVYADENGLLDLPRPKLLGRHQIENAGCAIAALRFSDIFKLPMDAFEAGMLNAEWPARMQRLGAGNLLDRLPDGSELWLDGGHNAGGGQAVASSLAELEERVPKPLVLIVGMLNTKDAGGFLASFAGIARHLIAVPVNSENARKPDEIAKLADSVGLKAEAASSLDEALKHVHRLDLAGPPRVMITGSLYLAGQVLETNGTPPQ